MHSIRHAEAVRRRHPAAVRGLVASCALAAALGAGCAGRKPQSELVRMKNFAVTPDSISVAVGDTVVFRNDDVVPHTATALDRSWDSGNLAPGQSYRHVVQQAGRIEYECTLHPNMRGVIVAK